MLNFKKIFLFFSFFIFNMLQFLLASNSSTYLKNPMDVDQVIHLPFPISAENQSDEVRIVISQNLDDLNLKLSIFKKFEEFKLVSEIEMSTFTLKRILSSLKNFKNLTQLKIHLLDHLNLIDDETFSLISGCDQLQELSIDFLNYPPFDQFKNVTDLGLNSLTKLKNLKSLKLNLRHTKITQGGFDPLLSLPQLEYFNLDIEYSFLDINLMNLDKNEIIFNDKYCENLEMKIKESSYIKFQNKVLKLRPRFQLATYEKYY